MKEDKYGAFRTDDLAIIPYRHHSHRTSWMVFVITQLPHAYERKFMVIAKNGEEAAWAAFRAWKSYKVEFKAYLRWLDDQKHKPIEEQEEENDDE